MSRAEQSSCTIDSAKITIVNFILTIMVLFIHSTNYAVYDLESSVVGLKIRAFQCFLRQIYDVAVPFFFLISGYLFYWNMSGKRIKDKLKKRIHSLVIPYLIWNVMAWFSIFIMTLFPFVSSRINSTLNMDFFSFFLDVILRCNPAAQLWYLRNLILFSILMLAPYYCLHRVHKYGRMIIGVVLFVLFLYLQQINNMNLMIGIFDGIIWYYIGMIVGVFYPLLPWKGGKIKYIGTLALVIFIVMCLLHQDSYIVHIVRNFSGIVGIWFTFDSIIAFNFTKTKNIPWLLKITFFIYCSHYILLESIEKIIFIIGGNNELSSVVDYFAAPLICIFIIAVMAYCLKRRTPKLFDVLTGGRG